MGIGNLNNNFGSLTAGGVNKTTNLKNTAKAETTVKNDVSFNADSLKSATLSDKEGVKFDSDNMTDNTEMLYAPKGKGKGKKKDWDTYFNEFCDDFKKRSGNSNISGFTTRKDGTPVPPTNQGGACCNSGGQGTVVGFLGAIYATWKTIFS